MRLLPKVHVDTGHSIAHYLNRYNNAESDKEMVKKELKLISKENPVVGEFIKRWALKERKTKQVVHTALCGILLYRLLCSQAEADQMAEYKLGD